MVGSTIAVMPAGYWVDSDMGLTELISYYMALKATVPRSDTTLDRILLRTGIC
jgi:hypothetical protein